MRAWEKWRQAPRNFDTNDRIVVRFTSICFISTNGRNCWMRRLEMGICVGPFRLSERRTIDSRQIARRYLRCNGYMVIENLILSI